MIFILDTTHRALKSGNVAIRLTKYECRLIEALAQGKSSHTDIINETWREAAPNTSIESLKVIVCRIRQKMRQSGLKPLIETVGGAGFFLSEPVQVVSAEPPISIPAEYRSMLEKLLYSHPNHAAADQVIALLAVQ